MTTTPPKIAGQRPKLIERLASNVNLYAGSKIAPTAFAVESLDEIIALVKQHAALTKVANCAEELLSEQASLSMAEERQTERERVEARHFYENAVMEAENKLSEAVEELNCLTKLKGGE